MNEQEIRQLEEIISLKPLMEGLNVVCHHDPEMVSKLKENIQAETQDIRDRIKEVMGDSAEEKFLLERLKWVLVQFKSDFSEKANEISEKYSRIQEYRESIDAMLQQTLRERISRFFSDKEKVIQGKLADSFDQFENWRMMGRQVRNGVSKGAGKVATFLSKRTSLEKNTAAFKIANNMEKLSDLTTVDSESLKTSVQRIFEEELGKPVLDDALRKIGDECLQFMVGQWEEKLNYRAKINLTRVLDEFGKGNDTGFTIEKRSTSAERTMKMGLATTAAATVSLAAGWHTLAYSFVNVFPPVAVFSVLAAMVVGRKRRARDIEERQIQMRETVTRMRNGLILEAISRNEGQEKGQKSLLGVLREANLKLARGIELSLLDPHIGNLGLTEYKILINATDNTLSKLNEYWKKVVEARDRGRDFENYIVSIFQSAKRFEFIEWRGDKIYKSIYPRTNQFPDLEFVERNTNTRFAIECKYRHSFRKGGEVKVSRKDQLERYRKFSRERKIPVFMVIGVGGTAKSPDRIFSVSVEQIEDSGIISRSLLASCAFDIQKF